MIRQATYSDIPALTQMVIAFFAGVEELESAGLYPDADTIEFMVQDYIDLDDRMVLVAEIEGQIVGAIAGGVAPWQFNANIMTLAELGWFVPSKFRTLYPKEAICLRNAFKKWGRSCGATTLIMSSTAREESPRVRRFYEKSGLALFDYNYLGKL